MSHLGSDGCARKRLSVKKRTLSDAAIDLELRKQRGTDPHVKRMLLTMALAATTLLAGCSSTPKTTPETASLQSGTKMLAAISVPSDWSISLQTSGRQNGHLVWDRSYAAPEAPDAALADFRKAVADAGWVAASGGQYTKDGLILTVTSSASSCVVGGDGCATVSAHLTTG